MKDRFIATKDEDALLDSLERYSKHNIDTKQSRDILITQNQAGMLRRMSLAGGGFLDRMGHLSNLRYDGHDLYYCGFRLVFSQEARRRTKKDLLPLIT